MKTKTKKPRPLYSARCPHCQLTTAYIKEELKLIPYVKMKSEIEQTPAVSEPVEIFRDYIAGVGFSDYKKVFSRLKEGQLLSLIWERSNKYDRDKGANYSNAIRIDFEGVKLGYVPSAKNKLVHQYRQGGAKITCELTAVNHGNPSHTLMCVSIKIAEQPNAGVTRSEGDQKISD